MTADNTFAEQRLGSQRARTKTILSLLALAFLALIFTRALATPARVPLDPRVQLDPGSFNLLQNGNKVGEMFVPKYDPADTKYVEHWVLFNGYVYPGKDPSLVTTIVVGRTHYESEADFFARVPWEQGFRYVRVDCTDTDRLPGR